MFTPHHVSRVTCHVSHVTCHVSPVTCQHFFCFFLLSGGASTWRVCYQRGLPRLNNIIKRSLLFKTFPDIPELQNIPELSWYSIILQIFIKLSDIPNLPWYSRPSLIFQVFPGVFKTFPDVPDLPRFPRPSLIFQAFFDILDLPCIPELHQ